MIKFSLSRVEVRRFVDIQVQDEIDCKVVVGNGAREKDKLSVER